MARIAACKHSRGQGMLAPWMSLAKSYQDIEWNTLPSQDDICSMVHVHYSKGSKESVKKKKNHA